MAQEPTNIISGTHLGGVFPALPPVDEDQGFRVCEPETHDSHEGGATAEPATEFDLWRAGYIKIAHIEAIVAHVADDECKEICALVEDFTPCINCQAGILQDALSEGPDSELWPGNDGESKQ